VRWFTPLVQVSRSSALRRVGLGFLVFNLSEWATWVALLVYAYGHGGATASGTVGGLLLLPAALAAPALGALADRYPPAWAVIGGYVAQGGTMLAVGAAMATGVPPLAVYAIALVYSATFVISRPAQAALLPTLTSSADELTATYVVAGWMETGALVLGPGVAGLMMTSHGTATVFIAFGALSLLSALPILTLVGRQVGPAGDELEAEQQGLLDSIREGIVEARAARGTMLLVGLLCAGAVLLGSLDVLYVQLALAELGMGEGGAGFLNAAFGVGAVLGSAATVLLIGRRRLVPPLYLGAGIAGIALLLLAIDITRPLAVLGIAGAGTGQALLQVTGRTFLQRITPEDALGRVFGLLEGVWYGGQGLGLLLVPALVALAGTRGALIGVGLVVPVAALLAFRTLRAVDLAAPDRSAKIAMLHGYGPLALVRSPALETLAAALEDLTAAAGDVIIRQGDAGDRFYLIASGTVSVTKDGHHLKDLGPGDGFGEIALLRNRPRTATITAIDDVQLWALHGETFVLAVTGHAPAAHAADDLIDAMDREVARGADGTADPG
jgi:MFS family permease